jgi:hypothetical protein
MSPTQVDVWSTEDGSRATVAVTAVLDASPTVKRRQGVPRHELSQRVEEHFATLRAATNWDEPTLLRRLGCPLRGAADLRKVETEKLTACARFLETVVTATTWVSTQFDRCMVVDECASLLRVIEKHGRVTDVGSKLDDELREIGREDLSPSGYMRLGEVDKAGAVVRARFDPRPVAATNPYAGTETVHLSESRIKLYLADERELLGSAVFDRITEHRLSCEPCERAVSFCAEHADSEQALTL